MDMVLLCIFNKGVRWNRKTYTHLENVHDTIAKKFKAKEAKQNAVKMETSIFITLMNSKLYEFNGRVSMDYAK